MKFKVEVTADDIAKGVREECAKCPIALAATRALGGGNRRVSVDGDGVIAFGDADGFTQFDVLPPAARRFVNDFDSGKGVEPFAFEVGGGLDEEYDE